jgi:hypothetical protein
MASILGSYLQSTGITGKKLSYKISKSEHKLYVVNGFRQHYITVNNTHVHHCHNWLIYLYKYKYECFKLAMCNYLICKST